MTSLRLFLVMNLLLLSAECKRHELHSALKVKMNAGISLQTPQSNATESIIQSTTLEQPSIVGENKQNKEKVTQELLLLEDQKNKLQQQLSLMEDQTTKVQTSLKAARRELTATLVEKSRAQKEMADNVLKTTKVESNDGKCPPIAAAAVCEVCKEEEPLPFLSHDALTFICVALLLCFLGAISHLQSSFQKITKSEKKLLLMKTAHDESKKLLLQLQEASQRSKGNQQQQRTAVSLIPDSPPAQDHQEKLDALSDTIKSLKRQLKAVKEEAEMSEQRIDELQLELKMLNVDKEVMLAKQTAMESLLRAGNNQHQQDDVAVERSAHIAELYTLSTELEAARTETDIANGYIQTQLGARNKKVKA